MYIESVTLQGFRCFGDEPETITLEPDLTALIGNNGTGKTAACHAVRRIFGISTDERTVRPDDFHVRPDEEDEPTSRSLRVEVILAFPELDGTGGDLSAVPDFFRHMAADDQGTLKCRLVLESTWTADGTIDGAIETRLLAVTKLQGEYTREEAFAVSPAERSRIQFVYVPASRDGARQVTIFLRGRLWRAAQWSQELRELVGTTATQIGDTFRKEQPTRTVEEAFHRRWDELHGAGTHSIPRFQPLGPDVDQLLRNAELAFEPDHTSAARPAHLLSDGQRSLLHLALTTASLDIEAALAEASSANGFDIEAAYLPTLTILAVEEPENNLSAFYLSRIIGQVLELGSTPRVQSLVSSHSASALSRIEPSKVRYFRHHDDTVRVRPITLPDDGTEAGTYVREAVRAHPELYFARFVVLGEGDSEEVVIPMIARALDIDLDPSFIAMVPLGGRHTQHFWRLLTDLQIPHATLLDPDYGRAGGGVERLREACGNLQSVGVDALEDLDGFEWPDDPHQLGPDDAQRVIGQLRKHGVFFSALLDLDMMMLCRYWDAYTKLEDGMNGPQQSDATQAVIGTGGSPQERAYWLPATDAVQSAQRQAELRWYRYLFSNRSKPATHLRALSTLKPEELQDPPEVLKALIEFIRETARL